MDFFQHQDNARRRTGGLVVLLVLAVLGVAVTTHLAVAGALAVAGDGDTRLLRHPGLFGGITGLTVLLIGGGALWKRAQLRDGGVRMLDSMGAREVGSGDGDDSRVLRNVVEEMSIASGVPVPRLRVLRGEESINGFVTGTSAADATLVVTGGALRKLSRDELQALVAHEYSHLLNGDTRLNLRLVAVLHGLLAVALCGRIVLESLRHVRVGGSSSRKKDDGAGAVLAFILLVGVSLWLVGSLGRFFANLIRLAIGRQREFLADAAAVQFTRNPDAMVSLLARIASDAAGPRLANANALAFSHFFFSRINRPFLSGWFSTHPDLEERIRRIQPAWRAPAGQAAPKPAARPGRTSPREAGLVGLAEVQEAPARVADAVGHPEQEHLARVRETLEALPPALRDAGGDPLVAQAIVLLLLTLDNRLTPDTVVLALKGGERGLDRELRALWNLRHTLGPAARLPLLDLCLPALRGMTPAQHARFRAAVDAVCALDPAPTLLETLLRHLLARHLDAHYQRPPLRGVRHYRLEEVREAGAALLSALAGAVSADADSAAHAFAAAVGADPDTAGWTHTPVPEAERLPAVTRGLDTLARASFQIRRILLVAATGIIRHDRVIQAAEAEWLRAIADALECPLPPWLGSPVPRD